MTTETNVDDIINYDFDEDEATLRAKYLQDHPQVNADQAKELIRQRRLVTGNKPHRVLMHATFLDGFTPEAQGVLFGPEGMDGICSIAILYSPSTEAIAKSIADGPGNTIPIKAFSAKEIHAAEEWSLAQPIH